MSGRVSGGLAGLVERVETAGALQSSFLVGRARKAREPWFLRAFSRRPAVVREAGYALACPCTHRHSPIITLLHCARLHRICRRVQMVVNSEQRKRVGK